MKQDKSSEEQVQAMMRAVRNCQVVLGQMADGFRSCIATLNLVVRKYRTALIRARYEREVQNRLRYFQPRGKVALHNWDWLKVRW